MDIWLLGNVVLWLNGKMAALHKVAQCHIQESLLRVFCELISLSAHIPIAVYQEVSHTHNTEAPSEFLLKVCSGSLKTAMDWSICFLFLPLGTIFALTPRYLSTQVLKRLSLECESSICQKKILRKYPLLLINQ